METKTRWWQSSIGYIIYPESFQDSNGDGVGDLPGIVSRLDYLKELGINLIWVCPIFASPMEDNGYDVSDFYAINPKYGTFEDFKNFLKEAHNREIKVLIDLPLNQTSAEHPWFKKALEDPNSEERGYYIFQKGKWVDGKLMPPNNWMGFFSTSAWERVGESDEFYLHLFGANMPDVNWANPKLRQRYCEICKYYLDLGVDGFRLDAVAHLAKDMSFADSALPPDSNGLVYDTDKFSNRPELFSYLKVLKDEVFSHYDCLTVGEVGGCIDPKKSLLLSDRENGSIDMVFNFDTVWNNGAFCSIDKRDDEIKTDVLLLKDNFQRWYDTCHEHADMPLYWCNHDHPRVLSQYGDVNYRNESAKMLLTTLLFMYGTPFIYNGEEIGMSNVEYESVEDFASDVNSVNQVTYFKEKGYSDEEIIRYLNRTSRINARTPMQWNQSEYAGFSTAKPINKVCQNYLKGVNVLDEMKDPWSIINFYQYAILKRRRWDINEAVVNGKWSLLDRNHPDVFAYIHEGPEDLVCISNFRPYTVYFSFYYRITDVILHNYDQVLLKNKVFELRPYESLLFFAKM